MLLYLSLYLSLNRRRGCKTAAAGWRASLNELFSKSFVFVFLFVFETGEEDEEEECAGLQLQAGRLAGVPPSMNGGTALLVAPQLPNPPSTYR